MLKRLIRRWQGRQIPKAKRQNAARQDAARQEPGRQDVSGMARGVLTRSLLTQSALLLRAAQIDGEVSESERDLLLRLMRRAFSLQEAEARDLFAQASQEAEEATDLFVWTAAINRDMNEEEKRDLIAHLWRVVYADGHCDDFESNLMRRLAGLLHVPDRVSAEIRRAVLAADS